MANDFFYSNRIGSVVVVTIFLMFFSCQFFYVKYGLIEFQFLNMMAGILAIPFVYNKVNNKFYIFVLLLTVFAVVTTLLSGKNKVGDVAFAFSMPFVGVLMCFYREELKIPSLIFCVGVLLYCGLAIVSGSDLNTELFESSSRNYISVLVLFSFFSLYVSKGRGYMTSIIFFCVLCVAILSNSRSALFSVSVLAFGFLLPTLKRNKLFSLFSIVFFALPFLLLVIMNGDAVYNFLYDSLGVFRRISVSSISDGGRADVISCYINSFGLNQLLFGLDVFGGQGCSYLANGTDNPHNSFIRMYTNVGFFSFVLMAIIVIAVANLWKRKDYVLISFLLCFLMRGSTDIIFFFQSWDAYFWALMIISLPSFFCRSVVDVENHNFTKYRG